MKRVILGAALAATLLLGSHSAVLAQGDQAPIAAGTKVPAFSLNSVKGQRISSASLRGKVVLMDFWATWCGPCQMATPTMQSLNQQFAPKGLKVIGVSVDDSNSVAEVGPFIKRFGMTYFVSTSPDANQTSAQAFNVSGIPSQYLIDKKGIVRWSQAGYSPEEKPQLTALIKKLLAERP